MLLDNSTRDDNDDTEKELYELIVIADESDTCDGEGRTTNDSEEINIASVVDSLSDDNNDGDGVEDIKEENDEMSLAIGVICTDEKLE